MSRRLLPVLLGGLALLLSLPAIAAAAPVTVNLRIEGKTSTLYEGKVTTDIRTIDAAGTAHTCDGTNNSANPTPGPTRGAAFAAAAAGPGGFAYTATWSDQFEDITFTTVAGQSVAFDPGTGAFFGEFKNGVSSNVGSCQDKISEGDDVLYAYAPFNAPLLKLSGPATAHPGTATVRVTDATSGDPIAGASVGGAATGADGRVNVPIHLATNTFKATKPGTVRSNRFTVCGSTGSDGVCGAADTTPPSSSLLDIAEKHHFARGKGPRRLRAHINADPSGLSEVKLRLTRNAPHAGHCTFFSGRLERFRRGRLIDGSRCGTRRAFWFFVEPQSDIDFLLPKRLGPGRYVLDVKAIDKAGNRDDERQRGRNRVVFYVS